MPHFVYGRPILDSEVYVVRITSPSFCRISKNETERYGIKNNPSFPKEILIMNVFYNSDHGLKRFEAMFFFLSINEFIGTE